MNLEPYLSRLITYIIEKTDYAGYDPYDALNSPLLRLLSRPSKWARIAFTQGLKRCPVNVRPILGVIKGHNPKAIGLFLWGYAKLYAVEKKPEYLERISCLLGLLEKLGSNGFWAARYHMPGWRNKRLF